MSGIFSGLVTLALAVWKWLTSPKKDDGLGRVRAATEADKKVDLSPEGEAHDPNSRP